MAPLLVVKARLNNFASTFDQRNGTSKQQHVMKVMRTVLRKTGNLARYMVQQPDRGLARWCENETIPIVFATRAAHARIS